MILFPTVWLTQEQLVIIQQEYLQDKLDTSYKTTSGKVFINKDAGIGFINAKKPEKSFIFTDNEDIAVEIQKSGLI